MSFKNKPHISDCVLPKNINQYPDFTGHETQMSTEADKVMVTDMGIVNNLPFPAALRPERGIEMFLVFDWSWKKCESEHPFRVRDSLVCTTSCIQQNFVLPTPF